MLCNEIVNVQSFLMSSIFAKLTKPLRDILYFVSFFFFSIYRNTIQDVIKNRKGTIVQRKFFFYWERKFLFAINSMEGFRVPEFLFNKVAGQWRFSMKF